MMCVTDGVLRAALDGEIGEAEQLELKEHLALCPSCRARAELAAANAQETLRAFNVLQLGAEEPPVDPALAFARFRARNRAAESQSASILVRMFARRWRPAWALLALVFVGVCCMSLAPARSWAQKILAMLRVQKVAVVPVDFRALTGQGNDRSTKMLTSMLSDNLVVTMKPDEPKPVTNPALASQIVGFRVRLLRARTDTPTIKVQGEAAFHMDINRDRLQAILNEAGRSDVQLPPALDGATVAVHVPKMAFIDYGGCAERKRDNSPPDTPPVEKMKNCVGLLEIPTPTVSVPPDLNIAEVAEAGLQLAGMKPDEARAFCQTVDWTSTLVIPVPRDASSYQTTEVDGVPATLIIDTGWGDRVLPAYMLIWVKNGIIYSLHGAGEATEALNLAQSMN